MTIKVLHLIDSGGLYGAEMMLLDLVRQQVASGLKPLILSIAVPSVKEKALEVEALKRGLPIKVFRMKAGLNPIKALQIVQYAKKESFDLLHSHGYKFNILMGMIPVFIRKIPVIATLHGYTSAGGFSKMRVYQRLERLMLNRLDGVVYVSQSIKDKPILKGFCAKKESVILNGVDVKRISASMFNPEGDSIEKFFPNEKGTCVYIGAIGRLSPEKGFDLLIDAFNDIAIEDSKLRLIIIGEGSLRPQLEKKIRVYGLQNKIKLVGYVSPVYRLMGDIDILVMPSLTEGLPITLLEACVLKLSVIATRVGSIEEVLSEYPASILILPGSISELKQAIIQFSGNGANSLAEKGGWSATAFDCKSMSNKYEVFYRQLLSA